MKINVGEKKYMVFQWQIVAKELTTKLSTLYDKLFAIAANRSELFGFIPIVQLEYENPNFSLKISF